MPKLRFPQFAASDELLETTVGDIAPQITTGGTPDTSEKSFWNGELRWMSSGDLSLRRVYDVEGRITELGLRNSSTKVIPERCVLIGLAGQGRTRGTVAMNMVSLCTNQSIAAIFPNAAAFDSDFLFYNLDGRYDELRKLSANGEGRGGLNLHLIRNLPILLPSLAEQSKIGECLTSLDEVIDAQARKVKALKNYKRGLMQYLFPQEGELLPRLRFPQFRDAQEWREVKAAALFANRSERGDNALPIYSVTMADGLVKRSLLDRRIDDLADAEENKRAHKYDLVYNMMRMWQGACGVAPEECMVSPAYVVLAPQSQVHSQFYGYLFKLPQMLRLFTAHSRGLTEDRLRLYYQDFASISLPQPDVSEQQRIADCLSAVDVRISLELKKLEEWKVHRKGLMQRLFPSPDKG